MMTEEDLVFWSDHCVPVLASLMKSAGSYSLEEQASHRDFFTRHVLTTFGPRPASDQEQHLFMTHNGSPIELSLNLSDAKPPQVRFSFTPMTRPDDVAKAVGADMSWFDQLADEYFLSDDLSAKVKAAVPPCIPRIPSCLAALNYEGPSRSLKGYFGHMVKSMATGNYGNAGAFEAVKRLRPGGEEMALALNKIEDFGKLEPEGSFVATMIGIDCVDPLLARVKLYTRIQSNAFDHVHRVITLGGTMVDETTLRGLDILRDSWPLLLNVDSGSYDASINIPELQPDSLHSGIMVTWEVKPGRSEPEAKVYVPLFQFCNNNKVITANMEKVFRKRGWTWGADGSYRRAIEDAFAHNQVYEKEEVVHTYCTFNFSKRGSYITSYVSTPLGIKPMT